MKIALLLLLLSTTALATEPDFHYQDCVRIVSGFYKGCKGKVDRLEAEDPADVQYRIDLFCKGRNPSEEFKPKQLTPAKDCKEQ